MDDEIADIISDELTAQSILRKKKKDDKVAARKKRSREREERLQKSLESLNPEERAKLLKRVEEWRRQSIIGRVLMRSWVGLGLGPWEIN